MNRMTSIALAVAATVGLAAAGFSVSAQDSRERGPGHRHAEESAHKGGKAHGQGMQRMDGKHEHDRMAGMHKCMEQHAKRSDPEAPAKPEAETHKH